MPDPNQSALTATDPLLKRLEFWILGVLSPRDYAILDGMWPEARFETSERAIVIETSGPPVVVDTRRPVITLTMIGSRRGPEADMKEAEEIRLDAEKLIEASISQEVEPPCGTANIRALSEPDGVSYTEEARPWLTLTFEVIC